MYDPVLPSDYGFPDYFFGLFDIFLPWMVHLQCWWVFVCLGFKYFLINCLKTITITEMVNKMSSDIRDNLAGGRHLHFQQSGGTPCLHLLQTRPPRRMEAPNHTCSGSFVIVVEAPVLALLPQTNFRIELPTQVLFGRIRHLRFLSQEVPSFISYAAPSNAEEKHTHSVFRPRPKNFLGYRSLYAEN